MFFLMDLLNALTLKHIDMFFLMDILKHTNIETHTGHIFLDGSSKCANTNIETHTGHLMDLLNAPTLT